MGDSGGDGGSDGDGDGGSGADGDCGGDGGGAPGGIDRRPLRRGDLRSPLWSRGRPGPTVPVTAAVTAPVTVTATAAVTHTGSDADPRLRTFGLDPEMNLY